MRRNKALHQENLHVSMNHVVPDWNAAADARLSPNLLPVSNLKTTMGPDHELVELLWQNGHPVLNSQTHRKPLFTSNELKQVHRPDQPVKGSAGSTGNMSNSIQEDETASWLQYPIDESLEKDFCSEFFYEMPTVDAVDADRLSKEVPMEAEKCPKFGAAEETNASVMHGSARSQPLSSPHSVDNGLPPPRPHVTGSVPQAFNSTRIVNFSHFARPVKADKGLPKGLCGEKAPGNVIQGEVGESSIITVGSSHCGSNHVQNETNMSRSSSNAFCHKDVMTGAVKEDACKMFPYNEMRQMDVVEPTVTSSSGQSGGSLGRMSKVTESNRSHKRKGRDAEEPECYSEEAGYESAEANKPPLRSASARRSRAAEVHNLSERRRRDRINEKMKALQELIPHCNKSDKASMLDEAIEYLKSLQLQVQIMWMGSGMAPMMFPSVQHYLARMSLGMGHSPLHSIHGTMQLPSVPIVNQSFTSTLLQNQPAMGPSPVLNPINFHNQIQNANMSESYAHYLGFHPMQMAPQAMNLFTYGAQTMSQTERTAQPSSNGGPCNGVPSDNSQHSNLG